MVLGLGHKNSDNPIWVNVVLIGGYVDVVVPIVGYIYFRSRTSQSQPMPEMPRWSLVVGRWSLVVGRQGGARLVLRSGITLRPMMRSLVRP
jgi:hypothetical protein